MLETLRDLYAHQAWADAEHWTAIEACPAALSDDELRDRITHLHTVQRGFLKIFKGDLTNVEEEFKNKPPLPERKSSAREYHREALACLNELPVERLDERLVVPWFTGGFSPTLREGALQGVMHSLYHRGQNATRIKQLGGKPPLTDYIVWVYKGRPAAVWPD